MDPGSSSPCRMHALARPGTLTLKGHRVAERACVSPRPQTRVEGQTDNVRADTWLRQVLQTLGSCRTMIPITGHSPPYFPLPTCHAVTLLLSLGCWVRETVSYFTRWRRSFLKERCIDTDAHAPQSAGRHVGRLQLEPAALQVLCTDFGEPGSQPLAPLSPLPGPRGP